MRTMLLGLVAVAALALGSLFAVGSPQAMPVTAGGHFNALVDSMSAIDQVRLVCHREPHCGPMGHCRPVRVCEQVPDGPGFGVGPGIPGSGLGPGSNRCLRCGPAGHCRSVC